MGVTAQSFYFINSNIDKYYPNFKSIVELGDQQFMSCAPFEELSHVRDYYDSLGKQYTSIDLNGNGGALKLNLNEPINIRKYDIVTNIGTLEHVDNFYMGFKNMHNLCNEFGLMMHISPKTGNWPNHGKNYIDCGFFDRLNKFCNYEILANFYALTNIGGSNSEQVYVIFKKLPVSKFDLTEEEFYSCGVNNS